METTLSSEVEFDDWNTPFKDCKSIGILKCTFGGGGFEYRSAEGKSVSIPASHETGPNGLLVDSVCFDQATTYQVLFNDVEAFRFLDEAGLVEIWEATSNQGGRPALATFKVRNHGWSRESVIPFLYAGSWSHMIATQNDCVEVLCQEEPQVSVTGAVEFLDQDPVERAP